MSMSERVAQLRAHSLRTKESISVERARLMTEYYQQDSGLLSVPMKRALSFQYLHATQDRLHQRRRTHRG